MTVPQTDFFNVDKPTEFKDEPPKRIGRPPGAKNKNVKSEPTADKPPRGMGEVKKLVWKESASVEATLLTGWENFIIAPLSLIEPYDAKILAEHGPLVIHEFIELAIVDRKYRRILEMLARPGKYGGLLMAVTGMILPILSHHGVNPMDNLMKNLFTPKADGGEGAILVSNSATFYDGSVL